MNICYLDFWGGFDPNCNWFNLLFLDLFDGKDINFNSSPEEADIIMASSFGDRKRSVTNLKATRIFYTGENERPDLDFCDYSLSFDFDTYGGRNFRLPHWFLYINWWNTPNFPHARISLDQLYTNPIPEDVWNRKEFCSIVIGNPVQNRLEVASKLNAYKPVHGYGRVFGNFYEGCKVNLLENYKFNICFENSITDGYVTEKLLEAKVAGCIPIYYGDPSVKIDFNEKCFINYRNFESSDALVENVILLNECKENFIEMVSQPLFTTPPTLGPLKEFLVDKFKR